MRRVAVTLGVLISTSLVIAQDRLAHEETQRYAAVCVEQAGKPSDAPIPTDPHPEKAWAVRGEGGGAMAVPDKMLTADRLKNLGAEVVPVGQLWLRKWTLVMGEKAVPPEQLRLVTVNVEDKDRPMILLLMGLRQSEKGPELLVYTRGNEPFLVLPLKGVDFVPALPLELAWERGERQTDPLTITVVGRYQAKLSVTRSGQ